MDRRVHAFTDDALGDDDAVALARRLRRHEVAPAELHAAVAARAARVEPHLHGLALDRTADPVTGAVDGPLAGVPTLVKDNVEVRGWPAGHGTRAFVPAPSREHAEVTRQLLACGLDLLGTTRMPEYGLNASTEFADDEPTRNPWDPRFSAGASSGGAAALVAAGVVPLAHANDGGGSIRIPAAACGLVGLKPSRGRLAPNATGARMPIDLVADGVVSRSVRDTAVFLGAADRGRRNPALPPLGLVEGPARRRLRVGLLLESPTGAAVDADTRETVTAVAQLLSKQGHEVSEAHSGVGTRFVDDFLDYWGLLAFSVVTGGRLLHGRTFDPHRLDGLTHGLADHYRRALARTRCSCTGCAGSRRPTPSCSPGTTCCSPRCSHTPRRRSGGSRRRCRSSSSPPGCWTTSRSPRSPTSPGRPRSHCPPVRRRAGCRWGCTCRPRSATSGRCWSSRTRSRPTAPGGGSRTDPPPGPPLRRCRGAPAPARSPRTAP